MTVEITVRVDANNISVDTPSGLGLSLWTPEGEILIVGEPHVVEFVQELIQKSFTDAAKA